jgi:DNA 3'-phosphatase
MKELNEIKKYEVIFSDLDGTLIDTISGKTFPKGIWDMKIKFDVLDKIKEIKPKCLLIVTNQGGIEKGFVNRRNFEFKMEYLCRSIKEYTGVEVEYSYCDTNDLNNEYRKPNIGMVNSLMYKMVNKSIIDNGIALHNILMIGDASGKEGQFSDSDKRCALNAGFDYMDVNDFINYGKISN